MASFAGYSVLGVWRNGSYFSYKVQWDAIYKKHVGQSDANRSQFNSEEECRQFVGLTLQYGIAKDKHEYGKWSRHFELMFTGTPTGTYDSIHQNSVRVIVGGDRVLTAYPIDVFVQNTALPTYNMVK